jgi:hypothetical protein
VEQDVLGPPYERQTIDLGTDDEGPVVATLVRRRADRPTGRAVLYVHGFVDDFFQTHVADFFAERAGTSRAGLRVQHDLAPDPELAATSATRSWTPPRGHPRGRRARHPARHGHSTGG